MAGEEEKKGSEQGRAFYRSSKRGPLQASILCADSVGNTAATLTIIAVGLMNE